MLIYLVEDDNSIRELVAYTRTVRDLRRKALRDLLLFGAPAPKDDRIWFCLT